MFRENVGISLHLKTVAILVVDLSRSFYNVVSTKNRLKLGRQLLQEKNDRL